MIPSHAKTALSKVGDGAVLLSKEIYHVIFR